MELGAPAVQVIGSDPQSASEEDGVLEATRDKDAPDDPPAPAPDSVAESTPSAAEENAKREEAEVYDPTPVIQGYDSPMDETTEAEKREDSTVADLHTLISNVYQGAIHAEPETEANESQKGITVDTPPTKQDPSSASNEVEESTSPSPIADATVESIVETVDPLQARLTEAWSLMFGSRYEDSVVKENVRNHHATRDSSAKPMRSPQSTNKAVSSLRRKLDQERHLDEQIQGARSKIRKRPGADQSVAHGAKHAPNVKPAPWLAEGRPFEDAGLTPTVVRFCVEKAMVSTTHCIAQLHVIAQNEPEPPVSDLPMGLYVTQWELNEILAELLRDRSASVMSTTVSLHNAEYAGLPLETLLRVSWFLPLDQFSRLRNLVAEVSRKRLSEGRIAILNGVLHRHFVLRPHPGIKMQRLLLRVVYHLKPPQDSNQEPQDDVLQGEMQKNEATRIVIELLHALYIRIPYPSPKISIASFMLLSPFELVTQLQLTSIISIQRIMFFRFLIEALGMEKASKEAGTNNWWPRSTGKPAQMSGRMKNEAVSEASTLVRTIPKRKKRPPRFDPPKEDDPDIKDVQDTIPTDVTSETPIGSTIATQGSVPSPVEKIVPKPISVVDESPTVAFKRLNDALASSLSKLVRINPWLVEDNQEPQTSQASTATRAMFLAAEAFQQSLGLLQASGTPVSPSILLKMEEFIMNIESLVREPEQKEDQPERAQLDDTKSQPQPDELVKSSPLPVQRANSGSFPPPYTVRSPSYWTFEPEMPPPSTPTPASCSIPRSISKVTSSPGVGDYDVKRSDRLRFPQQGGHTFSKEGLGTVDEIGSRTLPAKTVSPRKHRMDRVNSIDSLDSLTDPPQYTHWASAANDKKDLEDSEVADEDVIDVQVRDALRLQQSFVLDDLVQSLLHKGRPSNASKTMKNYRPTKTVCGVPSNVQAPQTRTAGRLRTAKAHAIMEPMKKIKAKLPSPPYEKPVERDVKQPPRDYEPPVDEAHLDWAARVSEFYKAKLKTVAAAESMRER